MREFVLCPGGRNAAWVIYLEQLQMAMPFAIRVHLHFEERSAAFFALSRIKVTGNPVAVVTTSGTAVANLLPGMMEAFYSGLPLVALTADRPQRFRSSGAPQAVEQTGIFSHYCHSSYDLSESSTLPKLDFALAGPSHINLCMEEYREPKNLESLFKSFLQQADRATRETPELCSPSPLMPTGPGEEKLKRFLNRPRLVLLSALPRAEQAKVKAWLLAYGGPIYAEAGSGLKEDPDLQHLMLRSGEGILQSEFFRSHIEGVLRIGQVPTCRYWRDIEQSEGAAEVLNISHLPFSGLSFIRESPLDLRSLSQELAGAIVNFPRRF